jgi:flagellin
VAGLRAENGSDQSNLGFQLELTAAAKVNQESAISRIMDVDVAEESTRLARYNTLVQAGTSMIAQANGSAQSALQLLR